MIRQAKLKNFSVCGSSVSRGTLKGAPTPEDETIDISNPLEEERLSESAPKPVKDADSASLNNNSKLTTTSSSSINANKRYI
ncbi:unnamed protein product [Rotaria sp. Silwood1]|nr:unnamed protein product [Rotaria sp. Silwood1]